MLKQEINVFFSVLWLELNISPVEMTRSVSKLIDRCDPIKALVPHKHVLSDRQGDQSSIVDPARLGQKIVLL
jgi:hypothetical protein